MPRPLTCKGAYWVFFQLWLILLHDVVSTDVPAADFPNVAVTGTASQRSTYKGGDASRAIDGNKDTVYSHGSCTHTALGRDGQWWSLQLPTTHKIVSVSITNGDYDSNFPSKITLVIGDSPEDNANNNTSCAVFDDKPIATTRDFDCGGMEGRFVNLYLEKTDPEIAMQLCEVEVRGIEIPSHSAVVNGRSIFVMGRKLGWSDALFYCRDRKLDLFSIRDEMEQKEVAQVLKNVSFPLTKQLWMGLRRQVRGPTWFWMSGEDKAFTYFGDVSTVWQNTHACGSIDSEEAYRWTNHPCDDALNFICMADDQPNKVKFYSSVRP